MLSDDIFSRIKSSGANKGRTAIDLIQRFIKAVGNLRSKTGKGKRTKDKKIQYKGNTPGVKLKKIPSHKTGSKKHSNIKIESITNGYTKAANDKNDVFDSSNKKPFNSVGRKAASFDDTYNEFGGKRVAIEDVADKCIKLAAQKNANRSQNDTERLEENTYRLLR